MNLLNFGQKSQDANVKPGDVLFKDGHQIKTTSNDRPRNLWSADKFIQETKEAEAAGKDPVTGILVAGDVDQTQEAFLKETTMLPSNEGSQPDGKIIRNI